MDNFILTWKDKQGRDDSMVFDTVFSFSPKYNVKITQNPVQVGQDKTDHVRPTPDEFIIKAAFQDEYNDGQSLELFNNLHSIQLSAFTCGFLTDAEFYENLLIKDIKPDGPLNPKQTGVIQFDLTLQRVVTTDIIITDAPKDARPVQAQKKEDKGNKDAKVERPSTLKIDYIETGSFGKALIRRH